jgi:hypothetical protein
MTTTPRLWNSLTQVNTTDGGTAQFQSGITPLQDGGYVVVWTDLSHTYNPLGEAVVGQRYNAVGNKVGGEVMLSQFTNGDQFSPAITTLANGNVAVAFDDLFTGDNDIYVRVFDPFAESCQGGRYRPRAEPDVPPRADRACRRQLRGLLHAH